MTVYERINRSVFITFINFTLNAPVDWFRQWWAYNWRRWVMSTWTEPKTKEPEDFRPTEQRAIASIRKQSFAAASYRFEQKMAMRGNHVRKSRLG